MKAFTSFTLLSLVMFHASKKTGGVPREDDLAVLINDVLDLKNSVRRMNMYLVEQEALSKRGEGHHFDLQQKEERDLREKLLAVVAEQKVTLKSQNDVIQHLHALLTTKNVRSYIF